MSDLQALLFDVDGTLADTERDGHRVSFNQAFEEEGLDWHWDSELYLKLLAVTGGKERIRHYLDQYRPEFPHPSDLDDFIARLHQIKTRHFADILATGGIPLRPGVGRLLQEARGQGVRLAITTTTTPANVTALLEHTLAPGSSDWFELIAAGDVVPHKKPAPDIYFYALDKMGLRADQCLAFEDSGNGIRASSAAGIKTIITVNDYTRHEDFSDAAAVLDCLGEPDRPFTIIKGRPWQGTYATMNYVREVFAGDC